MIKWLRRLFLTAVILTLLITNVLSLTSTAVNAALTGLVATALGISTVTGMLHKKIASHRAANTRLQSKVALHKTSVRNMGQRLASRSKRIATLSLTEVAASFIPFAGMTLIAAGTAYELSLMCRSLRDLLEIHIQMEIEEPVDAGALQKVCHPSEWLSNKGSEQQ
jgi:hypothetical protein